VKGKTQLHAAAWTTSRLRSLGGADEEVLGRVEGLLARRRFGSTFVAGQRWIPKDGREPREL